MPDNIQPLPQVKAGSPLSAAVENEIRRRVDYLIGARPGRGLVGSAGNIGVPPVTEEEYPFRVALKYGTAATVQVGPERATTGYPCLDSIRVGTTTIAKTTAEDVVCTAAGVIYYAIATDTPAAVATFGATVPANTSTVVNWPLAQILWNAVTSEIIRVVPLHKGTIYVAC